MLVAQGRVSPTCLWPHGDAAWPCAAAQLLPLWWIKKPDWNQLVPHGSPEQPFRGAGPCQGCVLDSVCVEDSCVPQHSTWLKLALGMHSTKAGMPAAVLCPPVLLILKLELKKLADFPLLEMLYLSCFLIKGRNSSPACRSLCGVSALFVVSHTTNTYL